MPQPDFGAPFSLGPMPTGLWGDEYRAAGGVTIEDLDNWRAQQNAEIDRMREMAAEARRQEEAAAAARAQEERFAQASEQFIDWPTYQTRAGGNPRETYVDYVQRVLPAQWSGMGYTPEEIAEGLQLFTQSVPQPEADYGFFGNLWESASQGARSGTSAMQVAGAAAQGDLDAIAEQVSKSALEGGDTVGPLARFNEAIGGANIRTDPWEAFTGYASAFVDNPQGAFNFLAQQLAQSYPVLAAGFAAGAAGVPTGPGAVVTGAAGAAAGSATLEFGAQMIQMLQQEAQARGVNLNDPVAVRQMMDLPDVYAALKQKALDKGLTVGAFDGISTLFSAGLGSLGGRALRAGRVMTSAGYGAGGIAGGAALGGLGEATSQAVIGDDFDYTEIMGEVFGGAGTDVVTTGAGALYGGITGRRPQAPPAPTPTPTPPTEPPPQENLPAFEPELPPIRVAPDGTAFAETPENLAQYDELRAAAQRAEDELRQLRDFEQRYADATRRPTDVLEADFVATDTANDEAALRAFLRENGVTSGGFTRSIQAQEIIDLIVNAPDDSKREAIAESIDGLQGSDLRFAEPMATALVRLAATLPTPDAQKIVDTATVQPDRALVDVIKQTAAIRTGSERRAAREMWLQHFDETPRDVAAEDARRVAIADEAWARVQQESRLEAMMETYQRQPVNQAQLDSAANQLDRVLARVGARTPTSRAKLQQLRMRAQLLLKESVDAYNRNLGESAGAGDEGGGAAAGGGGAAAGRAVLTAGGRSSTASAVTPLQYRYLNELGGRRAVGTSIGERLLADRLGIEPDQVVTTVAQAMAHYVVGKPLTAEGLIPAGELPFASPENTPQRRVSNVDPTRYLETGRVGQGIRRANRTLDEVASREREQQAAAALEAKRRERTTRSNTLYRRNLRPGELIPTADIVAGERGPLPAGAGGAGAAQGPGGGLRAGVAQARVDQSERARELARERAARSGKAVAGEPNAAERNQGVSRVGLGTQYPMAERPATRGDVEVGYALRNPLVARETMPVDRPSAAVKIEELKANQRLRKKVPAKAPKEMGKLLREYANTLRELGVQDAKYEAARRAAEAADRKKKKGKLSRGLKKDARLEAEAVYDELYGRDLDADMQEIFDPSYEGLDVPRTGSTDSRVRLSDARGLNEYQLANLTGSTDDVLAYLEAAASNPLQRLVAGQLRKLGLDLPPIKFGPIDNGRVSGRYEFTRGVFNRMAYQILIDPDMASLTTVLHELVHAATMRLIAEPETVAQKQAVAQLEQLMAYVMQVRPELAAIAGKPGPGYGLKNLQEFIAVALTDTHFQRQLAEISVPKHPNFSVLQALRALIFKLFGINPDTSTSNILQEVFAATPQLMSGKQITASGWRALDSRANPLAPPAVTRTRANPLAPPAVARTRATAPAQAPAPAPSIRSTRVPSTAIVGMAPTGERTYVAYERKADTYTLYRVTPQEPRGDPSTKEVDLTRAEVEQRIIDAGSKVVPPTSGTTIAPGAPKNTSKTLVGYDNNGNLRNIAYEQKDGTWTYYESDNDVRTDPRAKVQKRLSKQQVERYIAAQGRTPTAPTSGAVQSAANAPTPITYEAPWYIRVFLQDSEATLKQIDDQQVKQGVPAPQRIGVNAVLRNSRVKTKYEQVRRQYIEPTRLAAEDIAKRFNKTAAEIEEVLQVLHVPERMDAKRRQVERGDWDAQTQNAKLKQLQDNADEATARLRALNQSNPQFVSAVQQELAPKVKAMSDNTIDMMAEYGLISRATAESIKAAYDYYVPLQHGEKTTVGKAATGVSTSGDNSFARMVEQVHRVIARGEQNLIRRQVKDLAEKAGLFRFDPKTGQTTPAVHVGGTQRVWYDPATNSLNEGTDMHVFDDTSIDVYDNGNRVRITISDPTLLEALHPYKGEERQTFITLMLSLWARLTHLVAIGKTSLNPLFPTFNMVRDILAAQINAPSGVSRAKFNYHLMNPKTHADVLAAVMGDLFGKEYAGQIGEAKDVGAFITHRAFLGGTDEVSRSMDAMFGRTKLMEEGGKRRAWNKLRARGSQASSKTFDILSVAAQYSETLPRYAMYKAARDSGMSKEEAAYAAKIASINFERRGVVNPSNWWIFGNAKLQGLRALYDTGRRMGAPGAVLGAAGIVMLGAAAGAVGVALSDRDRDGKSKYVKIPDYRKDSMLLLKEGTIGVPIPQEVAPLYVLGNALAEMAGGRPGGEVASRIITSLVNNTWVGNVPQQELVGHRADWFEFAFRAMLPSVAQPAFDIVSNQNTFGSEVVPHLRDRLKRGTPKHEMGSPTEPQLAVNTAKRAYDWTGGTIDMAPQQMRLLNNFYNPLAEGFAFVRDLVSPRDPKYIGDEPNPLARRWIGQATQFYDQHQFDELLSRAQRAKYMAEQHGINSLAEEDQVLARSAAMLAKKKSDADNLFKNQKLIPPERRAMLNDRKQELLLEGIKRYNEYRDRVIQPK